MSTNTITPVSFLSYFANTTPESEHKRVRLKTIMFLQGSKLYDVRQALDNLTMSKVSTGKEKTSILCLEKAILQGKVAFILLFRIWIALKKHYSSATIALHYLYSFMTFAMQPLLKRIVRLVEKSYQVGLHNQLGSSVLCNYGPQHFSLLQRGLPLDRGWAQWAGKIVLMMG